MRTVKLDQRSEEWLKWRKSGIGSSDVAAIIGKSPYKTAYQVWQELMGLRQSDEINPMMQRGIDYEDEAREYLRDPDLKPMCIEHDHYNYFHASLDGLGHNYFVEIKVPSPKNFQSYKQDIPSHYYIQVQWQFLVSGLKTCIFLAYSPEHKCGYRIEIKPDEDVMEELEQKASKFWEDYQKGTSPPFSSNDIQEISGKELKESCDSYQKWHEIKNQAEEECAKQKEKIMKYGDGNSFRAYGIKCIKTNPRSSYDIEAMRKDGIDVEKYKKMSESGSFMLRVIESA